MNFGAAISKPFSNITNLVIGIVLTIIPIINILTIPGYMLRLANRTMKKDNALPGFENFGELVVNSLKAIVVGIVYAIIFLIVTFILVLIPLIGGVLSLIWMIVFGFIVISAMMTLAKAGDIGAALNIPEIAKKAATGNFIIAVIVGAVVTAIVLFIVLAIIAVIFGSAALPMLMSGNPAAIAAASQAIVGSILVGMVILWIVGYIIEVFFYSLVAESYPA